MTAANLVELLPIDLRRVISRLPRDVMAILKEETMFLAGGFIRSTIAGEKANDIDLFGPDKVRLDRVAFELALARNGRKHDSDNAFTVLSPGRTPVQMIHRWLYDDPCKLMAEFDFTIARACIWCVNNEEGIRWQSAIDSRFYPDLAAKRLVYCSPERNEDAGGSLLRVRKFLRAGYFINAENLAAVIARLCSQIDWDKADSNKEEWVTVVLTGMLRAVDPLEIIDGLDLVDECKL